MRPIAEFNGIPGIAVTFIVPTWPGLSVQQAVGSQRKKFEWSSFILATSKKRVGLVSLNTSEQRASSVIRCYESFVPAPTVLHPLCLKDTESLGRGEKSFKNLDVRPGSRLSGNL
jgi:hypothetical protein